MKFVVLAIFALSVVAVADTAPQTITTRDGTKYEQAVITGTDATALTITYDAGIAHIPLENLPADLQKQIGYVSKTEQAKALDEQAKALQEADKQKKAAYAAIKSATDAEANAYWNMKESDVLAKFGQPVKQLKDKDNEGHTFKILVYEENTPTSTMFTIYDDDGFVFSGVYKGKTIINPAQQAKIDAQKH